MKGRRLVSAQMLLDPQAAASEANRLITNEKVTAIIGTQASTLSMAATVVAEKNKVFYLENEGISSLITSRGFKYTFRTTFDSDMMAYQMIDFGRRSCCAENREKSPKIFVLPSSRRMEDLELRQEKGDGQGQDLGPQ